MLFNNFIIVLELLVYVLYFNKAKSRKYRGLCKVKSRVKTRHVREIWSQQLEHKQVPKRETESGVRNGKLSLVACHTRCKCFIETTRHSVFKAKLRYQSPEIGGKYDRLGSHCY